ASAPSELTYATRSPSSTPSAKNSARQRRYSATSLCRHHVWPRKPGRETEPAPPNGATWRGYARPHIPQLQRLRRTGLAGTIVRVGCGEPDGVAARIAASGDVDNLVDQPQAEGRPREGTVGRVGRGFGCERVGEGIG